MKVEINNRLYNDFASWAQANNMNDDDIQKYIEKAFRDKFNLDKYGDLNDKLVKETPRKIKKKAELKPNEPINELINGDVKPEKPKRKTKVIASK